MADDSDDLDETGDRPHRVTDGERVLVPLEVLESETLDEDLADLLTVLDVVVAGYHEVPEQTPPGQMRQQFEKQATAKVEEATETLRDEGAVQSHMVFTGDAEESIDRLADEESATGLVLVNPTGPVESLLVPLRGDVDAERIARFVATLRAGRDIDVTLFAAVTEGNADAASDLLDLARSTLIDQGVPDDAIVTTTELSATPVQTIVDAAIEHDAVVMGERQPDWRSLVFGQLEDRVAAESLGPVIVVRGKPTDAGTE